MKFTCIFLVCLAVFTVNAANVERVATKAPRGRVTIDNKEYYISAYKADAIDAVMICEDFNMKLAILDTEYTAGVIYQFILDNYDDDGSGYWISARKLQTDFQWTGNGILVYWSDWAAGEPNLNIPWDVCVYFHPIEGWYDAECSGVFNYFMCEPIV